MRWIVEYYKDDKGKEPVAEFLDSLATKVQAKAFRLLELLGEYGVLLKEPYTRQVKGKLRELRLKDTEGNIRVFYFTFTGKRFVLLHAFIKKTLRTPKREMEIAENRMNDFISQNRGKL